MGPAIYSVLSGYYIAAGPACYAAQAADGNGQMSSAVTAKGMLRYPIHSSFAGRSMTAKREGHRAIAEKSTSAMPSRSNSLSPQGEEAATLAVPSKPMTFCRFHPMPARAGRTKQQLPKRPYTACPAISFQTAARRGSGHFPAADKASNVVPLPSMPARAKAGPYTQRESQSPVALFFRCRASGEGSGQFTPAVRPICTSRFHPSMPARAGRTIVRVPKGHSKCCPAIFSDAARVRRKRPSWKLSHKTMRWLPLPKLVERKVNEHV